MPIVGAFALGMTLELALQRLPWSAALTCGRESIDARGGRLVVAIESFVWNRRRSRDVGDGALVLAARERSRSEVVAEGVRPLCRLGREGGLALTNADGETIDRFGLLVGPATARRLVDGLRPADASS